MDSPLQGLRTIEVALEANPYPIVIGEGCLARLGAAITALGFAAGTRVLVVTHPVVEQHYGSTSDGEPEGCQFRRPSAW